LGTNVGGGRRQHSDKMGEGVLGRFGIQIAPEWCEPEARMGASWAAIEMAEIKK
jgi:hypothetical protein